MVGVLLGGRHGDASLMAGLPILRTDQNRIIRFKPPLLDEFAGQCFNHGAMATEGVYRRAGVSVKMTLILEGFERDGVLNLLVPDVSPEPHHLAHPVPRFTR
jgi:hypothetical protein